MNITFSDYVNKIRMEETVLLMKTTSKSINEIALHVGFSDPNYFSKVFKGIMVLHQRNIAKFMNE